jgi:hypothetical protein
MAWSAEWRTKGQQNDAVFVLDDQHGLRQAFSATQPALARLLTQMGDLASWKGASVAVDERNPDAWGELVISRAETGEVIEVDPELFWQGIYVWFRSQGVDYDSPGLEDGPSQRAVPTLRRSSLMDD